MTYWVYVDKHHNPAMTQNSEDIPTSADVKLITEDIKEALAKKDSLS